MNGLYGKEKKNKKQCFIVTFFFCGYTELELECVIRHARYVCVSKYTQTHFISVIGQHSE